MKKLLFAAGLFSLGAAHAGTANSTIAPTSGPLSLAGAGTALFINEVDATAENPALLTQSETKVGDFVFHAMLRNAYINTSKSAATGGKMYADDTNYVPLPSLGLFYRQSDKLTFST